VVDATLSHDHSAQHSANTVVLQGKPIRSSGQRIEFQLRTVAGHRALVQ